MDFRIWRYELPLCSPVSLKPGLTMGVREGLLLELLDDEGRSFWGEAAPLPGFSRESVAEALDELKFSVERHIEVVTSPAEGFGEVIEETERFMGAPPSVRFALDHALASMSAADGDILPAQVSPMASDSISLCGLLSGSREEILSEAEAMRDAGYEAVKLKVGRRAVEEDAALVGEVRGILGDGAALRLDANRAWTFEEARRFAGLIPDAGIEFVEEPLGEPGRLRELSEMSGLPVALDESVPGMEPRDLARHAYARAFVLKPTLVGLYEILHFDTAVERLGTGAAGNGRPKPVGIVVSAAYESGVGTLGLMALAAAARAGNAAAGLDTYRRLAEDIVYPPLDLAKPRLDMKEVFGVRREVDYERLERLV